MSTPVRSIRLQRRSSQSLDTLSGASGEIFFDADNNALRLYSNNQSGRLILADREWVTENSFSGDYNDLTNTPSLVSDWADITNKPAFVAVATTGDYNDLINTPSNLVAGPLDTLSDVTITSPLDNQVLRYVGGEWINSTLSTQDTTYTISVQTGLAGPQLTLAGSDSSFDNVEFAAGANATVTRTDANTITIAFDSTGFASETYVDTGLGFKADLSGAAFTGPVTLPNYSTAVRDAIVSPPPGTMIFNTDTVQLQVFDGTSWLSVSAA